MSNSCRLSQRWHQQFYRSPSFAGHHRCLQNFQPFREYRQLTKARPPRPIHIRTEQIDRSPIKPFPQPPKNDVVAREYEPDPKDRSKLNRIDPNEEIGEEMADVRAQLMNLEEELAIMREGPFGPRSEFMQSLPKDQREQLLEALAKEGLLEDEQEDLLTMAELERLAEEDEQDIGPAMSKRLGVTLRIPRKDQAYIRHFNQALQAAEDADGKDVQKNLNLWRWYLRCQQQVHNFSNIISTDVWRFVWNSQVELKVRPRHLVMLTNDMLNAQKSIEPRQWITYIESLHANGDTTTAIKVWQDQKDNLRNHPGLAEAFWNAGVRVYSASGQPSKAQELAFNALNNGISTPHILVPVITAWATSQSSDALIKAWACYLKLKEKTDGSMLPEIYDSISNAFLDADRGDMALSVFKDMMLMRESSAHDSKEVHKQAVRHFGEVLQNASTEEQINRIGLSALLILPRQFQNRFFFTSWIKKLIGDKRVDSAAMVVELMYERGIAPDAKPLNGIIGAWLREGSTGAQQKAEDMAWSMIEARAAFVTQRNASSQIDGKHFRSIIIDERDQSVRRKIPSATIETFSILLQHYTRRRNNEEAERLTSTMIDSCHIRPNSYIMNHWLFGDLRAGRIQMVWDKYCNLKHDIKPDLETFAALWDAAKVQFSKADSAHAKRFPKARELFAEMKDWGDALASSKARRAKDEFSAELYEQIVRVFCLSMDLPGTALAMHHMARSFNFYPTDNAVRLICGQAARLLPQEEYTDGRTPRSRRSNARNQSVMIRVAEIIETIEEKRKLSMVEQGVDADLVENPESELAQHLRLAVLTEFICMFMQKAQAEKGSYRNDLKIAADTMHVSLDGIDLDVTE